MLPQKQSPSKTCFRFIYVAATVLLFSCAAAAGPGDTARAPTGPTIVLDRSGILPTSLKIVAYGDIRFMDPGEKEKSHPVVRRALVQKIAQEKPDVLLISGDIPYNGSHKGDWAVMREETKPWQDAHLRIFPALGNHELAGDESVGLQNWWAEFPKINGRRWYSVQIANTYVIALDSDTRLELGSTQGDWLRNQLAHLPKETDFVLIELHHPPYTNSNDLTGHSARHQEHELGEMLEQAQSTMRARIVVVAGHVHNYERFLNHGVNYIVSGGGGAAPYPVGRSRGALYRGPGPNFHYLVFTVQGQELHCSMIKLMNPDSGEPPKWEERDSFKVVAPAR